MEHPGQALTRGARLSRLRIPHKLLLISGVYVAIIAGLQVIGSAALDFQSSVRAFVGGEGLWSKAQKDAVHHLITYTLLGREEEYLRFRSAMAVPLGDRKARLALAADPPDLEAADAGFIAGRNHPDDVRGMSRLVLRFGRWKQLRTALEIWPRADEVVDELVLLGEKIHREAAAGAIPVERQEELLAEIYALNARFTELEDAFSFTLGSAARTSRVAVLAAMVVLTALALGLGLWLSLRLSRDIAGGVLRLRDGARRVAAGDFSQRIAVRSADELAELAVGFNRMTDSLVAQIGELERREQALAEMDRLKRQLFANVSHELRTPLTLVLGPAGRLVADETLPGEVRQSAATIERSARLLLKHVNDLLDLSRLDSGRLELAWANSDLARLVRFVASHFEVPAADRAIRLEVATPSSLPAEFDPGRIERVLFNLVANAFKFTPDATFVRIECAADGAGRARIVVEDGGPGVPEALREAIFERFRQIDGEATRRRGGTGLGLAIVREFVALHGGAVAVESAPGGGARFVVELPLAAPAGVTLVAADAAAASAPDGGATLAEQALAEPDIARGSAVATAEPMAATGEPDPEGSDGTAERPLVLVVEDHPDMNDFIAHLLGLRFRVERAFDGLGGLELARELRPDLIVSDIMMPVMSGDQLLAEIRADPSFDLVPFLVLTAKADADLRVRLLQEGAQEFLLKPFTPAELVTRAENLLAVRRARLAAERQIAEQALVADRMAADIAALREQLVLDFGKLRRSETLLREAIAERVEQN